MSENNEVEVLNNPKEIIGAGHDIHGLSSISNLMRGLIPKRIMNRMFSAPEGQAEFEAIEKRLTKLNFANVEEKKIISETQIEETIPLINPYSYKGNTSKKFKQKRRTKSATKMKSKCGFNHNK